ncbi:MAG TPA: hypothetical protein VI756_14845, partial [Blastocatellia bacterium]
MMNTRCQACKGPAKKNGKDRNGNQRFRCYACKKTMIVPQPKPLDKMRLKMDKAVSVLQHLAEGCSINSTMRLTGVEKHTILDLLTLAGEKCEALSQKLIHGVTVKDLQLDEIWGFCGMKEKTKVKKGIDGDGLGDAWTYVAIERENKMVLAWHLGRRTMADTIEFTEKLAYATEGHHNFQV